MAIKGVATAQQEFTKKVGIFEAKVVAINPSLEELNDLGITVKDDSKMGEYLGEKDGLDTVRVSVWLEDVLSKNLFNVSFFLQDKVRYNKDETKIQYINSVGRTSWVDDIVNLPPWLTKNGETVRKAHVGEEELYNFGRAWLASILRDDSPEIDFEFNKLIKGNISVIKSMLKDDRAKTIIALATVKTVEKDGEVKEYQGVYNKAFLPGWAMKNFRLTKYDEAKIDSLKEKKKIIKSDGKRTYLKDYEEWLLQITDSEHGVKDFYITSIMKEYNPEENIATSPKTLVEDGDATY